MAVTNAPASHTTTLAGGGVVPMGMRSGVAQAAVTTTGATSTTPYGFATAAQADAIVTLVNEIRATLMAAGMIKGAA
jgi:hypothetical protein